MHPVPAEVRATYSAIIDGILKTSDLNTISSKRIREGLQAGIEYDLTPQKVRTRWLLSIAGDILQELPLIGLHTAGSH
jgi:DEK C terminal domain